MPGRDSGMQVSMFMVVLVVCGVLATQKVPDTTDVSLQNQTSTPSPTTQADVTPTPQEAGKSQPPEVPPGPDGAPLPEATSMPTPAEQSPTPSSALPSASEKEVIISIPTFDFTNNNGKKKTTPPPVDTCPSSDMCAHMPGVCHHGTCKAKACSTDFSCICDKGYTGQFCNKNDTNGEPKEPATNGTNGKNGNDTQANNKGNGKHLVNGNVNMNLIDGKLDNVVKTTDPTLSANGNKNGATLNNQTDSSSQASLHEQSNTTLLTTIDPSATNATVKAPQPVAQNITDKNAIQFADGSYRKGPESSRHSDNSPVDAHLTKQRVKTNPPAVIQTVGDVVTIPTTVVEANHSKLGTILHERVTQKTSASNAGIRHVKNPNKILNSQAKKEYDHLFSMVQRSEFVEQKAVTKTTSRRVGHQEKVHVVGTIHVGNHDVPVILASDTPEPTGLGNNALHSRQKINVNTKTKSNENTLNSKREKDGGQTNSDRGNTMINGANTLHSLDTLPQDNASSSDQEVIHQTAKRLTHMDPDVLTKLLEFINSTNFADTVSAVKIEIITKSNAMSNAENSVQDKNRTTDEKPRTPLILSTTTLPP